MFRGKEKMLVPFVPFLRVCVREFCTIWELCAIPLLKYRVKKYSSLGLVTIPSENTPPPPTHNFGFD